ncbi:MAG: hypothetical protein E6J20_20570 [Chloroflexi bacterium]|nr:MAG: hypothetical protein E6J20_20570 [Chloroflexota bacterium]
MNLEDLGEHYNLLVLSEIQDLRNEAEAAAVAGRALDALEADNPYLQAAAAGAIEELDVRVAADAVRDDRAFGQFIAQERSLLAEGGLSEAAIDRLTAQIEKERAAVAAEKEPRRPRLPLRTHIESLRRLLETNRREAIHRIGLVAGGCALVTLDVVFNPELVTKSLSMVFGGVLIDRGIPELRHPEAGH